MYVCVCKAVTERQVNEAIDQGATTVKALSRQLGVGSQCGACVGCAKECIQKTQQKNAKYPANVFPISDQDAA